MKYENKHLIVAFTVAVILTLIAVWVMGLVAKTVSGAPDLQADCPACPSCKITASKIIRDNPTIDLTNYDTGTTFKIPDKEGLELQIGEDTLTKVQLDSLRSK